jgi:hypothetical protein
MAMPGPQAARFGDLTFEEVRSYVAAESLAIIPTGCTEQQGPHLSVDFDTRFAETLALAAAQKAVHDSGVLSVVLPALPFGPTPEHRGYRAGYIHLPAELHAEVVAHTLRSLAEQGFKKLLVWRGCGGHDLDKAVKQFNKEWSGRATAFLPRLPSTASGVGLVTLTFPEGTPTVSRPRLRFVYVLKLSASSTSSTPPKVRSIGVLLTSTSASTPQVA